MRTCYAIISMCPRAADVRQADQPDPPTAKFVAALQGPVPPLFHARIHHLAGPSDMAGLGVAEQVPLPDPQPTSDARYHWLTLVPVESSTHRWYQAALETAFQEYVGVGSLMLPLGDIGTAARGGGVTSNARPLLHVPAPISFAVLIRRAPQASGSAARARSPAAPAA